VSKLNLTTILLAVSMAVSGCASGATPDDTGETVATTAEAVVIDPYEYHRGRDFGGKTVTMLLRQEFESEFDVENATGEVVDDAVYDRKVLAEELLGIKMEFISLPGSFSHRSTFTAAFMESVLAGDGAYDLVASAANYMLPLTAEGCFHNLLTAPSVQIEKPWYAQNYISNMTIDDKLYLVTGAASLNFLQNTCVLFFNKDLMAELKYELPYDQVRSGEWTFDALHALVKDSGADLNSDGVIDESDQIGYLTYNNMINAQIIGMGHHYIETGKDGVPYVIETLSERTIDVFDRVERFINDLNSTFHYIDMDNDALKATANMLKIWNTGNVLFYPNVLSTAESMRDSAFDFGIVPLPKSDTEQAEYYSFLLENVTVLGFPTTADAELSGCVLDVLSINGYEVLSPKYFDLELKEKYTRDTDTKDMLDIIRSSVAFEYPLATQFMAECIQNGSPLVSSYESRKNSMKNTYEKILNAYQELE